MIRVQVSCIAMRDNQFALIKKITPDSGAVYNYLISPGGHVEPRETLEEACVREMREETGLVVDDLEMIGVISFISHVSDYHSVCFLFRTQNVEGELCTQEPEKMEAHWIDMADVETHELIRDYDRVFLRHAAEGEGLLNARVEWFARNVPTFTIVDSADSNQKLVGK